MMSCLAEHGALAGEWQTRTCYRSISEPIYAASPRCLSKRAAAHPPNWAGAQLRAFAKASWACMHVRGLACTRSALTGILTDVPLGILLRSEH